MRVVINVILTNSLFVITIKHLKTTLPPWLITYFRYGPLRITPLVFRKNPKNGVIAIVLERSRGVWEKIGITWFMDGPLHYLQLSTFPLFSAFHSYVIHYFLPSFFHNFYRTTPFLSSLFVYICFNLYSPNCLLFPYCFPISLFSTSPPSPFPLLLDF